ncbi:MAG: hypothetical protein JOZ54_24160, partial [Acidobacteria bacterium]|nr:hypothetical protein [Acidobacteriota bacterium]
DALVDFFRKELDVPAIARAQRAWLEANAQMSTTVAGYVHALRSASSLRGAPAHAALPLFPALSVIERTADSITLRNDGDAPLRAREYGAPAYRVLAKLFDGERELADRWLALPGDLAPGETVNVETGFRPFQDGLKPAPTLRLYHALQGVPMLPPEPWYAAAL